MKFEYTSTGVVSTPSALSGTVYWYDSGTTENSETVYYSEDGDYAMWYDAVKWVIIDLNSDSVGGSPTNYFYAATITGTWTAAGSWSFTSFSIVADETCKSNWEWSNISRGRDYSYVDYDEYYRENWRATRFRYTDHEFDSQLGETEETALTAYNGNDSKDVAPPSYEALQFLQDFDLSGTSWTYASSGPVINGEILTLVGEDFYKAKWEYNGSPVYVMSGISPLGTDEQIMCFYEDNASYSTDWHCVSRNSDDVVNGNFPLGILATTTDTTQYIAGWPATDSEDPTYASHISTDDNIIPFRCISDTPSYDSRGVEWYKQTQIWQAKSPWT